MQQHVWDTAHKYGGTGALVYGERLVYAVAGRAEIVSEAASPPIVGVSQASSGAEARRLQTARRVTLDECEPGAPFLYSHGPFTHTAIDLSADALGIWALCVGRESEPTKKLLLVHLLAPDTLSVVRQWELTVDTSIYAEGTVLLVYYEYCTSSGAPLFLHIIDQ